MHAGPRRVDDDVYPLTLGADERVGERLGGGLRPEGFDLRFAAAHDEVTRTARSRTVGLRLNIVTFRSQHPRYGQLLVSDPPSRFVQPPTSARSMTMRRPLLVPQVLMTHCPTSAGFWSSRWSA